MDAFVCNRHTVLSLAAAYLAAFRSYLRSEYSEENIEFWLTCEKFRATASRENLSWKARGIYEEFVRPAASKEVRSLASLHPC